MKKVTLVLFLLSHLLFAQKLERYCELVATGGMFTHKVTISVDFGEGSQFFSDNRMRDDDGNFKRFNSVTDALNYMGSQNWKLVNAFPLSSGGSSKVLHFYFKKEYDASELKEQSDKK